MFGSDAIVKVSVVNEHTGDSATERIGTWQPIGAGDTSLTVDDKTGYLNSWLTKIQYGDLGIMT